MATLVSPGVSITVEDQSFYASAGAGTVPLIIVASAQDKASSTGAGIAGFTTKATAAQVKLITSQRDLLSNYGNPIFKTTGGTSLHGHELNEYGLQAAYSFLGLANRVYVLRADIDLAELEASDVPPSADPVSGSYWLDTSKTVWGLKAWDATTATWVTQEVKVPTASAMDAIEGKPKNSYGLDGDFAVQYWDASGNTVEVIKLYEKDAGTWTHVGSVDWNAGGRTFQVGSYLSLPASASDGDLLLQMDAPNNGSKLNVKIYTSGQFVTDTVYGTDSSTKAFNYFDKNGGLTAGDLWAEFNPSEASVVVKRHNGLDVVTATGSAIADVDVSTHAGAVSLTVVTGAISMDVFLNPNGTETLIGADEVVGALNNAFSSVPGHDLIASEDGGKVVIVSPSGQDFAIGGGAIPGFNASDIGLLDAVVYTNWEELSYEAKATAITGALKDGQLWYDSNISDNHIDILINSNGAWVTFTGDVNIAASTPEFRKDGASALQQGDVWVDTSDLENYPQVHRYSTTLGWVALDETDQESSDGILFADFRSSKTGALDADAPNGEFYPFGMLAWNKRLSGGNVKQWDANLGIWVDYSGNREDGSPRMLRKAQRAAVVKALQAAVSSNTDIRNETNRFNLIACPGYPELMDEMYALNVDRKETAFIIGDAPMRLSADASSIQAWANNENNAVENGEDGLMTYNPYTAVYYPHALTTGLDGQNVMVPASHIALRTLAFNDQVAFPWFAPAGFQRGLVSNATSVGYLDAESSEYVPVSLSEGQRDTLYINKINPIGNFPGRGLAVFGQKTLNPIESALDRVNVARLVVYIRERLDDIVKPFLFEPNDQITRINAKVIVDRFLANLVSQRGLYDFVTVCDSSNNTPDRIDRNELHIDIAIQPVKAVEFIYIPIRIQNTLVG